MDIVTQVNELLKTDQYRFITEDEHLGDRIIFLTLGGSHAYGTNVDGSDIDIRGVCHKKLNEMIGLSDFEQVTDIETDTTIYSFDKLVKLLLNVNPNCIETLGCKPEHYFMMTDIGRELISNRKLFLSQRAVTSFGEYANAQLFRLKNHIGVYAPSPEVNKEHVESTIRKSWNGSGGIAERHGFDENSISFELSRKKLYANIAEHTFDSVELCEALSHVNHIARSLTKLGDRNKKALSHNKLGKHAMHLVRLYLMCFDILEKEEIITYRENDHDLLMDIRNGKYQLENGTYAQEFFDMVEDYEKRLRYAAKNTSLPEEPAFKRIEEFVVDVNIRVVLSEN